MSIKSKARLKQREHIGERTLKSIAEGKVDRAYQRIRRSKGIVRLSDLKIVGEHFIKHGMTDELTELKTVLRTFGLVFEGFAKPDGQRHEPHDRAQFDSDNILVTSDGGKDGKDVAVFVHAIDGSGAEINPTEAFVFTANRLNKYRVMIGALNAEFMTEEAELNPEADKTSTG